mgnify:CR=1 FL=1|tara:strand:- start:4844 stop:5062 length:219 start_codon:yes stop_codon:yes gene_type:complete
MRESIIIKITVIFDCRDIDFKPDCPCQSIGKYANREKWISVQPLIQLCLRKGSLSGLHLESHIIRNFLKLAH